MLNATVFFLIKSDYFVWVVKKKGFFLITIYWQISAILKHSFSCLGRLQILSAFLFTFLDFLFLFRKGSSLGGVENVKKKPRQDFKYKDRQQARSVVNRGRNFLFFPN